MMTMMISFLVVLVLVLEVLDRDKISKANKDRGKIEDLDLDLITIFSAEDSLVSEEDSQALEDSEWEMISEETCNLALNLPLLEVV